MKITPKKIVIISYIILFIGIIVFFSAFGPLLPWSPIRPGFNRIDFDKGIVFYPSETNLDLYYYALDTLMNEAESFFKLQFKEKVNVIVCQSDAQCRRLSFQADHTYTLPTGTVIYINPSIKKTGRDLLGFLRHELAHAILYQQTTFSNARKLKPWLKQGLSVYYGNPHHYYSGPKFLKLAIDERYFIDILNDRANPGNIPKRYRERFVYGEYRAFIEYLIYTYSLDALLKYMTICLQHPERDREIFLRMFNISLARAFKKFHEKLQENRVAMQ